MRISQTIIIAILVGLTSAGIVFWKQASALEGPTGSPPLMVNQADAVFAGGCFWCVESDYDKLDGVLETISGYTGGNGDNPTYKNHTSKGHYEAVRVIYDPRKISYDELVTYFWRHVDPTDAGGQFCDRGDSYRTAIFVETDAERDVAEAQKAALDAQGILPGPVVTPVLDQSTFWPAETYHQDYYTKNPLRYRYYRLSCGRDSKIKDIWSKADEMPENALN